MEVELEKIEKIISKNKNISKNEFLDENDYLAFCENINLEKISNDISKSSSKINKLLRSLDAQKRPILLSALMICLFEKEKFTNSFKDNYLNFDAQNIIASIPTTVVKILSNENISQEKINILINELVFIKTDRDLNDTFVLKYILVELENNVIPLFKRKTNYDIIGKFYEEFLRYAGVTNVKKGIVLTPNHITTLFTELIEIKTNDIIFDPACGTGAFLISGMNKLIDKIENSNIANKKERIKNIKTNQLIGFEKSSMMYFLAISNMLFRGEGKSQIYNEDFFSNKTENILCQLEQQPTIGFINPPYGGKDNKSNPTKQEIQFLEKMLDNCSRYGIIIAPLSMFFKNNVERNRILSKHSLKYVINMPIELFQPNASTNTAIGVFETKTPHKNKVVMYNLENDGLVLSKVKGRTDVLNKWRNIKHGLLKKIYNPLQNENCIDLIYKDIKVNDEWIIQAHSKTNYLNLTEDSFKVTIKAYSIFLMKVKLDLLEKKLDEVKLLELFTSNHLDKAPIINKQLKLKKTIFKNFALNDIFTVRGSNKSFTKNEISYGEYLYVTTSNKNNGTTCTSNVFTENGNVITIDSATDGNAFYQESKFVGSDHVEILEPITFDLNKYTALFFVSILNLQVFRYGFGRKRSQTRIKQERIFLPTSNDGNLDFEYMECFIKSLPYSSNL